MKISIITATYNREKLLPVLYKSLIKNITDSAKLEWLIMDDGSTDSTEELVKKYIEENKVEIIYKKQINQGKMTAINNIIKYATGELLIELDSDDYLLDNAINTIVKRYNEIKEEDIYAMVFTRNIKSFKKFPKNNYKTKMFDIYFKECIYGDKTIVFINNIRKKYKYIVENGEKFSTEARMYHAIDKNYYVIGFNDNIVGGEYLSDGYTKNKLSMFKNSPKGFYNYFKEIFDMNLKGMNFNKRLYVIKHYILFGYLTKSKMNLKNVKGLFNKFLYIVLYIPGVFKTAKLFKNV